MSLFQLRTQLEHFLHPCCHFGSSGGEFCFHPSDESAAADVRTALRKKPLCYTDSVKSRMGNAAAGIAGVWLFSSAALFAQSAVAPMVDPTPPGQMHSLEQRIDRLAENLATAERQVDEDRRKMQSMQAELDDLRKTLAESGSGSSEPANASAVAQLQQAVTQIREEQEVVSSEVQQHEQTKLESASKFPVRFHGMVLFNAFVNEGVVDQLDLPTTALYRAPGQSHGSVGAGLRQTLLDFEGTGPSLWAGHISADASLDFFGGVTAGALGSPAGLARLRTAGIAWESPSDLLRFGYDGPLISPLSPTSLATVAQPALAWSGNLWTWAPQLRWEHRFSLAEDRQAGFEFGLYDPSYTAVDAIEADRSVSPGEAARQPGYETRFSYRTGKDRRALQLGVAGYYDRKNYGSGQTLDTWAGAADWVAPVTAHGQWSGEFYRGRGIGSLGGGAYRDAYTYTDPDSGQQEIGGLDSIGGWTQWKWNFSQAMQLNAVAGQDTGYADELSQSVPPNTNPLDYYARNRSLMANFIYRPWLSFVLSPEFRRISSWPTTGRVQTANVYTLSAGYEF